jgi:hypothetical protein
VLAGDAELVAEAQLAQAGPRVNLQHDLRFAREVLEDPLELVDHRRRQAVGVDAQVQGPGRAGGCRRGRLVAGAVDLRV